MADPAAKPKAKSKGRLFGLLTQPSVTELVKKSRGGKDDEPPPTSTRRVNPFMKSKTLWKSLAFAVRTKEVPPPNLRLRVDGTFVTIEGLGYLENFINHAEHDRILAELDSIAWEEVGEGKNKRRRMWYGSREELDHLDRLTGDRAAVPTFCEFIADRIMKHFPKETTTKPVGQMYFNQVEINEFNGGQGVRPHVDKVYSYEECVAIVSLGTPVVVTFQNIATLEIVDLLVDPRSVLVLSGPARYRWTAGITSKKVQRFMDADVVRERRVSITFRRVVI